MNTLGYHFYPRTVHPIAFRRGANQMFGHTNVQINSLLYDCPYGGDTAWYDAEEYLLDQIPFLSVYLTVDREVEEITDGLISGQKYNLRDIVREIKYGIFPPQAVNCVWGGRRVLRNIGVDSNARTPDEFLGEVLHLAQAVPGDELYPTGIRARRIQIRGEGWLPDTLFDRQG